MSYTVENGIIKSENGLPWTPRWFCDNRTAVQADNEQISEIDYFSKATNGSYIMFRPRFWKGLKFYFLNNGQRNIITPSSCEIYPFGFSSKGEVCGYEMYTANESIYFVFTPDFDGELEMQFYEEYLFKPDDSSNPDIRLRGDKRAWTDFKENNGIINVSFFEKETEIPIKISSNSKLSFAVVGGNKKYIIKNSQLKKGKETVICISFNNSSTESYRKIIDLQKERYRAVSKKAPVLKSGHKLLNQFFELAPLYHESLKTTDVSGGIRAQSSHYWIWGWDSMTSNNSQLYWGDKDFIGEMLDCFMKYSDESGIAHAFTRDMKCGGIAPAPAQGMYLTMLDNFRLAGGSIEKYYPFAKRIFEMICKTEVGNTGLCRGTSLYPDFRNLIKENGNDISTFNNTVSYCAIKAMQRLANAQNDVKTEKKAAEFSKRMKLSFEKALYNEDLGFFDSSADINGYVKRNVPSNNAVKWESNDCFDLVSGKMEECLDFYLKNLVSESGIRPIPEWSDCYDADANQLHCWWTVMSEFYIRLINKGDRPDYINKYISWIEYWSERLMCPEGISTYENKYDVPFDNWNAMCGIWQGYNIRGFYNAVVHGIVGVDFDEKGINFYPYSGEEMSLNNFRFGDKTFDIEMKGSGRRIKSVILNGEDLKEVYSVPFPKLEKYNRITVIRE